jgi:hypothetical protein
MDLHAQHDAAVKLKWREPGGTGEPYAVKLLNCQMCRPDKNGASEMTLFLSGGWTSHATLQIKQIYRFDFEVVKVLIFQALFPKRATASGNRTID